MENEATIIFGVSAGSVYEGGGSYRTLYFKKEDAINFALSEVEKKNHELERLHLSEKDEDPITWIFDRRLEKREDEDYWSDGYDYVCVDEFTVV